MALHLVVADARKAHSQQGGQQKDQRQNDLTAPRLRWDFSWILKHGRKAK